MVFSFGIFLAVSIFLEIMHARRAPAWFSLNNRLKYAIPYPRIAILIVHPRSVMYCRRSTCNIKIKYTRLFNPYADRDRKPLLAIIAK